MTKTYPSNKLLTRCSQTVTFVQPVGLECKVPRDVERLVRYLKRYRDACEIVKADIQSDKTIFLSFDHSLLFPWITPSRSGTLYDSVGIRTFELFSKHGDQTPYQLVLSSPTYYEILDQFHHRVTVMDRLSSGIGIRRLFKMLPAEVAVNEFRKISDQIKNGSPQNRNFQLFESLLSSGKIQGIGDAFSFGVHSEQLTIHAMELQKSALLDYKKYSQFDPVDRKFHIEIDALHVLGIITIDHLNSDDGRQLAYTGEYGVQATFAQKQASNCRDPLCVLLACMAYGKASSKPLPHGEALAYLNNFSDGMAQAIQLLNRYQSDNVCIERFFEDDKRKLKLLQEQYIVDIYRKSIEVDGNDVSNDVEVAEDYSVESLSDAIIKARDASAATSETAISLSRLVEQSADNSFFGGVENDAISDDAKRRMDEIIIGLGLD